MKDEHFIIYNKDEHAIRFTSLKSSDGNVSVSIESDESVKDIILSKQDIENIVLYFNGVDVEQIYAARFLEVEISTVNLMLYDDRMNYRIELIDKYGHLPFNDLLIKESISMAKKFIIANKQKENLGSIGR